MRVAPGTRVAWGVSALVAVLLLGPALLAPGSVLRGDMVFVPHQPWKDAWLGLDGSVPRAVPMDALVSVLSHVVPGAWLQKAFLLASFLIGGVGIGRLAERVVRATSWGVAAAVTAFLWNPWVVERLSIGQWATVAGYALLPWVAMSAWRLRDDRRRWHSVLVLLFLSAVCSPSNGVTAVLVAAVVVLGAPTRRSVGALVGCAAVANLPWAVPALTLGDRVTLGGAAAFDAFHAVAETPLGLLASVLSLGGIWKVSVVPGERTTLLVVGVALAVSVVAVAGLLRGPDEPRMRRTLAAVGALSVVVCVVPAWAPGVMATAAEAVPGLAMFRDSHRFLAPLGLVLALGLAAVASAIHRRAVTGREGLVVAVATLVAAPVLLLPSAAWGLSGDLRPVTFPHEWRDVADALDAAEAPGALVVLPWEGSYRRLGWNDARASLDPAPRLLPGDVLIDDRIVLGQETIPGEDPRSAEVDAALDDEDPRGALSALGVRWVLVEKPLPSALDVPEGRVVHDGTWLTLVDLGTASAVAPYTREWRWWLVLGADVLVALCMIGVLVVQPRGGRYAPART